MIAFHFPPLRGSSGIQRTLRFVQHLPDFGWRPVVLTVHPRAYESCGDDLVREIPAGVEVIRAPAWDTARHFAIANRYPDFAARPDRWISWLPGAVIYGNSAIRRHRPAAIWSTYPVATAHKVGMRLAAKSRLPWIADFRDPMAQDGYPQDPKTWKQFERIERETVARADVSTFTTPGAAELYRNRYPSQRSRITLIENGYDEESFSGVRPQSRIREGHVTLLHSGVVYPKERDPAALLAALRLLKEAEPSCYARIKVRFRAAAHDELIRRLAEQSGVADAVELLPAVGYRAALEEMMSADGLLVLQSASCNEQIPAKLYEYIRAGRPILALTDARGDTAATLRSAGVDSIAPLDDPRAIAQLLVRFCSAPEALALPSQLAVQRASRRMRAEELAALLGRTVAGR